MGSTEAGTAPRCYVPDISGGLPRPVTPDAALSGMFFSGMVSPDGLQLLYSRPDGDWATLPIRGGTSTPVPGLTTTDQIVRWSADGRALYLFRGDTLPYRFERLDIASGRRDLIREAAPADRTGVIGGLGAAMTDDTKSHAYCYGRMTSQLFVVEGAR